MTFSENVVSSKILRSVLEDFQVSLNELSANGLQMYRSESELETLLTQQQSVEASYETTQKRKQSEKIETTRGRERSKSQEQRIRKKANRDLLDEE